MSEDVKKLVGHNYAVSFDLGNGRSIQVNGNFYVDDTPEIMSSKLDGVMKVLERQRARAEVSDVYEVELKARQKRLAEMELQKAQMLAQIAAIEGKARQAPKDAQDLTALRANVAAQDVNMIRMKADIAEGVQALQECRHRAA